MDNKKLAMGIFIIVIMVSSTAGFILSYDADQKTKSDGKEFIDVGSYWLLREGNNDYYFVYLPGQVPEYKEIELDNSILLKGNLTQIQQNRLSYAFAANGVRFQELENEQDCDGQVQIIVIETGTQNIYKEGSCLFLQGDKEKLIDMLSYSLIYKNG